MLLEYCQSTLAQFFDHPDFFPFMETVAASSKRFLLTESRYSDNQYTLCPFSQFSLLECVPRNRPFQLTIDHRAFPTPFKEERRPLPRSTLLSFRRSEPRWPELFLLRMFLLPVAVSDKPAFDGTSCGVGSVYPCPHVRAFLEIVFSLKGSEDTMMQQRLQAHC